MRTAVVVGIHPGMSSKAWLPWTALCNTRFVGDTSMYSQLAARDVGSALTNSGRLAVDHGPNRNSIFGIAKAQCVFEGIAGSRRRMMVVGH